MPGTVPYPTLVFHLTDIENLSSMIASGQIMSRRDAPPRAANIAYQHLVKRAERTVVTCGPGGRVTDYARFFFAARPPMLWSIWDGRVPGATHESIVHLVSRAQQLSTVRDTVFSDGHVIEKLSDFYDDLDDLGVIDWSVMWQGQPQQLNSASVPVKYWKMIPSDPDRPRRRQAEFLVHRNAPWSSVTGIGVISDEMVKRVSALLPAPAPGTPPIPIVRCPHWYYG